MDRELWDLALASGFPAIHRALTIGRDKTGFKPQ